MAERKHGRRADETRPIKIELGVVPNATGSALFGLGNTVAIAAVYGPRLLHPKHLQQSDRAYLRTVYQLLPFSVSERARPGPNRRSTEICKVTREALEPAIFLEEFPKAVIDIFINIISADAGTRTAGINAASLALADAGIPMRDLVASVAAGRIDDEVVVDLEGKEEDLTDCDLPIAYLPRSKQFSLLQMDGHLTPEQAKQVIALATKECERIAELQKQALRDKWLKKGAAQALPPSKALAPAPAFAAVPTSAPSGAGAASAGASRAEALSGGQL